MLDFYQGYVFYTPVSSVPSSEARPRMLLSGIRSHHSQRTIPFESFQPFIQTSIQAMMLQTIDVRFYR